MLFEIICAICHSSIWVRGDFEWDTNALSLSERDWHWEEACQHIKDGGIYTIGGTEYDDPD